MVANIKRLKKAEIDVTSSIVIMRENEEYLDEIIDFVKKLGMNYYKHDFIRNVYGGTQNLHAPIMDTTLKKAFFTKPNFKTSRKRFHSAMVQNTCWYGKVAIKENGDVIPCEFEREFIYGNVKMHNINDIINSPRTLDKWFMDFTKIEGCKDCEYRYACKDCRPLGISICGSMTSKNPRCLYDPYKGEWGELPSVVKMGGH